METRFLKRSNATLVTLIVNGEKTFVKVLQFLNGLKQFDLTTKAVLVNDRLTSTDESQKENDAA